MNGEFVPWDDAKIHIRAHVIHYGSARLRGHPLLQRPRRARPSSGSTSTWSGSIDSGKIYRMEIPFTLDELNEAILETIGANELDGVLHPADRLPRLRRGSASTPSTARSTLPSWSGPGARTWAEDASSRASTSASRLEPRSRPTPCPAMAKAAANYMNSQLIKMEALKHGYAEGIALDADGYVSEGSGENLFVVTRRA